MPSGGAASIAGRLDRLPMSTLHLRIVLCLAFAFFFELGDLNTFSYAAPGLIKNMGLTIDDVARVTSGSFLGMFLGSVFGGRLSDALGRRRALLASVGFYSIFSLTTAFGQNVPELFAARVLTGIGLSAMTVIAITYLAELVPKDRRGRLQSATLAIGLLGIPATAFFARAVIPTGPDGWRWIFVFGSLGILFLALVPLLPESPRWLANAGRSAEAEAILTKLEAEVSAGRGPLPEPQPSAAFEPQPTHVRALFSGVLAQRTAMLWTVWIFQTLGFYGFMVWVPTLLSAHGFTIVKTLQWSSIISLGAVPGALLAWPISDRFGRKAPIIGVALVVSVCGLLYGFSNGEGAIETFGFLVALFIQTFAALLYAYTPELYPTAERNTGAGLAYGIGRLANIAGPLIVAALYQSYGYVSVFVYIAATWLLVAISVAALGPRTGELSLERIALADDAVVSGRAAPAG